MKLLQLLMLVLVVVTVVRAMRRKLATTKRMRARSSQQSPDPFQVLGVPRSATHTEIRSAYQRLIQQYHPDKVDTMGQELREVAERRTKEINEAYRALTRPRDTAS